jgi:hypothetical protein
LAANIKKRVVDYRMKITHRQLRQIIKKEMSSMLGEAHTQQYAPLDWEQSKTDVQDAAQLLANAIQGAKDIVEKKAAHATYTDTDAIDAQRIVLLGGQVQEALNALESALNKLTNDGDPMTPSTAMATDPWPVLSAQENT